MKADVYNCHYSKSENKTHTHELVGSCRFFLHQVLMDTHKESLDITPINSCGYLYITATEKQDISS